jgi:hypothetical protein
MLRSGVFVHSGYLQRRVGHHLNVHLREWQRAVAAAVVLATAGLWGAAPANADSGGVTLHYTCSWSVFPSQPMTAVVAWHAPPSIAVGQTTPTITVDATATIDAAVVSALDFVDAATIEGSADAPGTVVAPEGDIHAAVRLNVPRTPVPASGSMNVYATGTAPPLVFHQPGHARITVDNDLALHLTPRQSDGSATTVGEVDLSCTLDSGQDNVVYAFDVTPLAAAPPTPAQPGPVTSPATPAPRTSTTRPAPSGSSVLPPNSTPTSSTRSQPTSTSTALPAPAPTQTGEMDSLIRQTSTLALFWGTSWWWVAIGVLAALAIGVWWSTRRRRVSRR